MVDRQAEGLFQARAPQVGIDQQHLASGLGQHHGQGQGQRGFTLFRHRGGDLDGLDLGIRVGELQ